MNISGTAATTANTNPGQTTGAKRTSEPSVAFGDILQAQTGAEKANGSNTRISAEARWQQIAGNYDVTNISTRERAAMTGELLESGLISSTEGMALAAPYSMNENLDTKRDYLTISREALAFSKQNGASPQQVELQQKIAGILEKLFTLTDTAANNGVYTDSGALG